jgi:hypothetical protein
MEAPLIAVVGDANKCTQPELAKRACEELGGELAKQGCRLLVYSSSKEFVEWEFVRGYIQSRAKKEPKSIEVRYPPELEGRFDGEQEGDPLFVRSQQIGGWEASVFPSFASLDGLILVGGGYTTKISGLIALGSKTPVLTLSGFGGMAQEVWMHLRSDRHSMASDDDLNLMASKSWGENSAARHVASLLEQVRRKKEKEKETALGESEEHWRRALTILAWTGCGLFVLVLLAVVELTSKSPPVPRLSLWLLFGTPAIAGASGSTIRVLWDNWDQPAVPLTSRPISMIIALGFWASGVVGVLFSLPQIWISGGIDAAQLGKLSGFAVPIGLVAGLTLDKLFPKLIKLDVPVDGGVLGKKGRSAS